MNELLQRLLQVDVDVASRSLLEFLEGDSCFVGLIVCVLVFFGSRVVSGQPSLQSWGLRLAATSFLLYGGWLWLNGRFEDGTPWWRNALRCGNVAGIVLACAWIALPILTFVHRRLRLALAVFLGYGGYVVVSAGEWTPEATGTAALHGLAATGLALVVAWIVDPIWTAVASAFLPSKSVSATETPTREAAPLTVRPPLVTPAPMIVTGGDVPSEAQRRRDRARLQLELAYLQGMPGVASWMSRSLFDDFLRRHLGDHVQPEDAEDNARSLLQVLARHQDHARAPDQPPEFNGMEDLAAWLMSEQQRIQASDLDQPIKQHQLLDLHQRYLMLASRVMQKQSMLLR